MGAFAGFVSEVGNAYTVELAVLEGEGGLVRVRVEVCTCGDYPHSGGRGHAGAVCPGGGKGERER